MIVGDYTLALQKTKVGKIHDYDEEVLRELVKSDQASFCVINQNKKFNDLQAIWQNFYALKETDEQLQRRLGGSEIPSRKIHQIKLLSDPDLLSELLHFSYFDDNNNLCSFTLETLTSCPSIWFASVVINKAASLDQRQIILVVPEFSTSLTEENNKLTWCNHNIEIGMKVEESHLFNMDLLRNYLGYVLNNHFIEYSLTNLFDESGKVNLEKLRIIKNSIHNNASMFAFSDQKIEEISHRCELSKILASKKKIKTISGNKKDLDLQIELLEEAIKNYTPENYKDIKKNVDIMLFEDNYLSLKSRDVEEILYSDFLFSKDSFEFKNLRLTLILGAFPESSLKIKVKTLQKEINRISQDLDFLAGFKKESLIKDLNILAAILLNPSPDNFKKLEERIKTNEMATKNREKGGHVITSTTMAMLGVAAVAVITTGAVVVPIAAAIGLFGVGTSAAIAEYKASGKRAEYKTKLQNIENELNKGKGKDIENILGELRKILEHNKNGTNSLGTAKIMSVFKKIKYANNLYTVCNALAEVIYSFNETDIETANQLKNIRKELRKSLPQIVLSADSSIKDLTMFPNSISNNIHWAQNELNYFTDILFIGKTVERIDQQNQFREIVQFNHKIQIAIVTLIKRNTTNPVRDEILESLILTIRNESNRDKLITALDDAILALFENSKNSQIGEDLLMIRLCENTQEKQIQNQEMPDLGSFSFK
jgi:hypothetical protein